MGLKETYETAEGRPGDATAQLVAIVCSACSILPPRARFSLTSAQLLNVDL